MKDKRPKQIFIFSAIACVALRIFLKLSAIDPSTGFYEGDDLTVMIFNIILGVSIVLMFVLGLMKRPTVSVAAYRLPVKLLAMLTGASSIVLSLYGIYEQLTMLSGLGLMQGGVMLLYHLAGIASGILFIHLGLKMREDSTVFSASGTWLLLPLFWQIYILIDSFMTYTAIRSVSDQMLTVLMLIFLVPFLLAHGRVLGNVDPEKGIRHLYAFGLPFSLLALTVSVGTLTAAAAGRSVEIALNVPSAIFYLFMGLYAAALILCCKRN